MRKRVGYDKIVVARLVAIDVAALGIIRVALPVP
jgi:hypothetical protein